MLRPPPSLSTSPATATAPAPTLLDSIWDSIATPGVGPGLAATLNGSLCALLLCLAYFSWNGMFDAHIAVLAALCVCLLVTFNVFMAFVERARGEGGGGTEE